MPTFLVCIHHFETASPYKLHQFMAEQKIGKLYGAVPVDLPSLDVAEKLCDKARWNTFEKLGFALPEQIHEDEDYYTYYFSPFFKRQKTPFEQWNWHTKSESGNDFYTRIEDGWEFQDAKIDPMTWDEAADEWGCVDVATARRDYENWKKSTDARQDKPEDHSFYFLRECEEIAAFIPPAEATPTTAATTSLPYAPVEEETPVTQERKEKAMKNVTDWLFAFARAVEVIVETFKETGENFRYTNLAQQLEGEGWKPANTNRFNKDLGEQKDIRDLHALIKTRPQTSDTEKYEEWEKKFEEQARIYFERLIQGDREGLDPIACAEEYFVKKKLLLGEK